jgi:hypothetical protein
LRTHLHSVQQLGRDVPELQTPPVPPGLAHLLAFHAELASARAPGFSSPTPIAWGEIEAWSRLTSIALSPWEARVLRVLDTAWLSVWSECRAEAAPKPKKPS